MRLAYLSHENRGKTVPVSVSAGGKTLNLKLDMTKPAPIDGKLFPLGKIEAKAGSPISVTLSSQGAGGNAHADAVQFLPAK